VCYYNVDEEYTMAVEWFEKAAEKGERVSMYYLKETTGVAMMGTRT